MNLQKFYLSRQKVICAHGNRYVKGIGVLKASIWEYLKTDPEAPQLRQKKMFRKIYKQFAVNENAEQRRLDIIEELDAHTEKMLGDTPHVPE